MYYSDIEQFKSLCGYVIDDIWYPRVTKIVEIKAKPALYRFYAGMTSFSEGEKIKIASASEGTKIHSAVEQILTGKNPEIEPDIQPSVEAFKKFIETRKIQVDPEYVEKRVVNYEEGYAGTTDALAIIDGKFGVLDIKTSQAIYRDYSLQTSAYMAALFTTLPRLETRWILRIDQTKSCLLCGAILRSKGGRDKIKTDPKNGVMKNCAHNWSELKGETELQEFPYWQKDYAAFLGAKKLWEWENELWLGKIGYLA